MIEVKRSSNDDPLQFDVMVGSGTDRTHHQVSMSKDTCQRLTGGRHTPERCIEAAFGFLLDREPKEAILARFDITAISRYFPEFERELPGRLSQS